MISLHLLGPSGRCSKNLRKMRLDPLRQFARLRQQVVDEKKRLESRLREIDEVLQGDTGLEPKRVEMEPAFRRVGRRARHDNTMTMREAVIKALSGGPIARN